MPSFCVNCGRPYEAFEKFCNSCGKLLPRPTLDIPQTSETNKLQESIPHVTLPPGGESRPIPKNSLLNFRRFQSKKRFYRLQYRLRG